MKKIITLLLLIACACGAKAQIITTIAGGGTGGDGGPAIDAGFARPDGICMDTEGNIYFADNGQNSIRKINTSGIIFTIAGNGSAGYNGDDIAATSAELNFPGYVATDIYGNVYVPDDYNFRIRKISPSDIITTIAGNGTLGYSGDNMPATNAQIGHTGCICVDVNNNIYIADIQANVIRKVNTAGIITTFAGTGTGGNSGDNGPATAAEIRPFGLAADNAGNIYSAEYFNNSVRKINTSGVITTIAGIGSMGYSGDGAAATSAQMYYPDAVFVDRRNNMFVTEDGNNVVRMIDQLGMIYTIAGNGTSGNSGDGGPATNAELGLPSGVFRDNEGGIYITDWNNNNIRYISNTVAVNIIQHQKDGLSIYPNPSDGTFNILVSSKTIKQVYVSIVDQLGRMIRQLPVQTNEVTTVQEHIPPGAYFLSVKDGTNATETAKLFIR